MIQATTQRTMQAERIDEAFQEARASEARRRGWVLEQVLPQLDPSYDQAVAAAQSAADQARADARTAQQHLEAHGAARPRHAADVPGWAKQKAVLQDEAEAYALIAEDARNALEQAQEARAEQLRQIWGQLGRAAEQRLADFDAGVLADRNARQEEERRRVTEEDAEHRRLAAELEALRHFPPA